MYTVEFKNNNAYITLNDPIELKYTLDCGQAFRWQPKNERVWQGIAFGKYLELEKLSEQEIVLYNTDKEDFENIWRDYFDLERDYNKIITEISSNDVLKTAAGYGRGIRILNQEPWETLCSFIISQNNNIKRIKGIIAKLCEGFGEKIDGGYAFPTAQRLAELSVEELAGIRAGFRAKYIIDAAKKVAAGEVNLSTLKNLPEDEARAELMKIKGVGPKVADCALLFSHKHISAFPKDVWIKRAMQQLFSGELPEVAKPYAGIVQQYIFYYARETKLKME